MELFVVNGVCGGTAFALPDVPTVLGRSPESHVQVGDPWISSMHALFERRGQELWIVDLDSRNGTFVNGERIHEARIAAGMQLRFGKTGSELRAHSRSRETQDLISDQRTILCFVSDLVAEDAPREDSDPCKLFRGERLIPDARRHAAILNGIGRALLGAPSLAAALDRFLRVLGPTVRAERSCLLVTDERGELIPMATVPAERPPTRSASLLAATLRNRAGVLTLGSQESRSESPEIRSCINAPVWAENQVFGVLQLERSSGEPFSTDDLELATLAGFQAALAVERFRLEERERATRELRQRLQRVLGPETAAPLLTTDPALRPCLTPVFRSEVSIIVVDIDGLAPLAAATPDHVAARALALQRALAEAALSEGAAVDLRLDGGLLAVLDPLGAHADGAARAQRCAKAMLERAQRIEGDCDEPRLTLRVGVATGQALVGDFSAASSLELRAMGPAVDAARRLATLAHPGEIAAEEG